MRKYLNCVALIGAMAVYGHGADSTSTQSGSVLKTLERIQAKAGISFGGEFQSQFLSARIGGSGANARMRDAETAEFTAVDFDIKARPNTLTQGRLIFRMQQDWRNFYSDISNPIFTRWLSIDGSVKGMFSYNAGMFRQKYTPLTLYTPDIDIMYEPDLFVQQRRVAQNEMFIDDNQRLLQGVNLNFAAEVYPIFDALKVNVMGTRLRDVETSIKNGSKVTALIDTSWMEKFMAAGNADASFLKGLSVGGSFLNIFDNKASYYKDGGDTAADTMAQNTRIGDFRLGVDVGPLVKARNWKFGISAEMAFSSDDSSYYDTLGRAQAILDTVTTHRMPALNLQKKTIGGSAIKAEVNAGYTIPEVFNIAINAGFIKNTPDFRNELAQSPNFIGRRIMNFENDSIYNIQSPVYSTFDALYHQVFKFAPGKTPGAFSWWYKEPFTKNSYTSMTFTQDELAKAKYNYLVSEYLDPSVQLVMPFGPATPNRTGITGNATLGFLNDRIQARVLFASLSEVEETVVPATGTTAALTLPKTKYSQAGGGVKVELAKFVGWKYPINLSSSVVNSKASNDGISGNINYLATTITSNFYAENLYFKFWKRAAFLVGMELIQNKVTTTSDYTQNQMLTEVGLEYKVSEGAYVTGMVGQIDVTHPEPTGAEKANFNQKLVNLFLRVMF
jgi:hypothetical protein